MSDWVNGLEKAVPGKKAYLFVGESGNASDYLLKKISSGVDYVINVRPPFKSEELATVFGMPDETQLLVIRDLENLVANDWKLLYTYLSSKKVAGFSIALIGQSFPDQQVAMEVKKLIQRQGLFVDVNSPQGESGRNALVHWVSENWKITRSLALEACIRCNFSIGKLLWSYRVYFQLSGGKPLTGNTAQKFVYAAVPMEMVEDARHLLLNKKKAEALSLIDQFNPDQYLAFFRLIEASLTDLFLLNKVANNYKEITPKILSNKTGIHIVRVLDLEPYYLRYNSRTIAQCRHALQIALNNSNQPEAAELMVSLWG